MLYDNIEKQSKKINKQPLAQANCSNSPNGVRKGDEAIATDI